MMTRHCLPQTASATPGERIRKGYGTILGRGPTQAGGDSWPQYWRVLLATDEFLMVR